MSADAQLQYLSWALYVLIFVRVSVNAIRRPTPAHLDMVLFFGAATLIILLGGIAPALQLSSPVLADISGGLLLSLGYLLLRLVADFANVPRWLLRASEVGLVVSVVMLVVLPTPMPLPAALLLVGSFVAVIVYDTWAFVREAGRTRGVTSRRMQAVALGSGLLGLVLLLALFGLAAPDQAAAWRELSRLAGLASGVSYLVGFAPPSWLRRAWQEPELRAFLGRAADLPHLPDTRSVVRELERGAAESLGAQGAAIGVWDASRARLRFYEPRAGDGRVAGDARLDGTESFTRREGVLELDPSTHPISGRAFREQRAILVTDVQRTDPANAAVYQAYGAGASLVAPISSAEHRWGVLVIYAPRAPVFANSDLELLQLLAQQAAVVLQSRALIEEAARLRGREEAARLKEDFLSSAAHDLKTPLTGLVGQAQLLQRRARKDPAAEDYRAGIDRLVNSGLQLRDLVMELLDAARLEHGQVVGECEEVDLSALAHEVAARAVPEQQRVRVEAPSRVIAAGDRVRLAQVLANLVENGLKYSPEGGDVVVRVWRETDEARLSVTDFGIGIPSQDLPLLFQRFHRGRNVDARRFAGMGLGLYIAHGIVEQHGGRLWVESTEGQGSTFHVAVPMRRSTAMPDSPRLAS